MGMTDLEKAEAVLTSFTCSSKLTDGKPRKIGKE